MMYKVVHGLVAVPTTHLTATEPTTVLSFGLSVVILRLTSISSFHEPFLLGTSYQQKPLKLCRRCIHASSSVVLPFISIGVISLPGVCWLTSRSRSRSLGIGCGFRYRIHDPSNIFKLWLRLPETETDCIVFTKMVVYLENQRVFPQNW